MKHHIDELSTPMQDAENERPSQDHTPRFGMDVSIRARGYTIKERDRDKEPIWIKGGIEFKHGEVLVREKLTA